MITREDALGSWATLAGPPRPGVVIIPDVWGVSDLYRRLAQRLAQEGFATLVVDQYRYTGRAGLSASSVLPFIAQLDDPAVLRAVQEAIDALAASPEVRGQKVGLVGFCMGGQYALLGACSCRGLSACAPFYGMVRYEAGLDPSKKPRQPLDAIPQLSCPLLGLYGAEDNLIPVADVEELKRRLARTPHVHAVHIYPGAGHAFLNDTRPEAYRPEAARAAWSELVPFLRRELGAP
ncbi:MAG TPA: dienelactone hydrolase family protein [Myxococcota bacterium]